MLLEVTTKVGMHTWTIKVVARATRPTRHVSLATFLATRRTPSYISLQHLVVTHYFYKRRLRLRDEGRPRREGIGSFFSRNNIESKRIHQLQHSCRMQGSSLHGPNLGKTLVSLWL
jgi:hypothetical protein